MNKAVLSHGLSRVKPGEKSGQRQRERVYIEPRRCYVVAKGERRQNLTGKPQTHSDT